MAKPHERVFALTFALLFLFSTVAVSGAVIYTIYKQNKTNEIVSQFDASGGSEENVQSAKDEQQQEEMKVLQGTQLEGYAPITTPITELTGRDIVEGTGEEVKPGATVTAHYTGAYASTGEIFQSSHDGPNQPIPFGLDQVIAGWTQGVPGMKVGGTRRLVIPGNMAYGEAPEGYTPGSTERPMGPLVFDIEITAVQNP